MGLPREHVVQLTPLQRKYSDFEGMLYDYMQLKPFNSFTKISTVNSKGLPDTRTKQSSKNPIRNAFSLIKNMWIKSIV